MRGLRASKRLVFFFHLRDPLDLDAEPLVNAEPHESQHDDRK
jgi:hypothetical protein